MLRMGCQPGSCRKHCGYDDKHAYDSAITPKAADLTGELQTRGTF